MSTPLWKIIVAGSVSFDIGDVVVGVFEGGAVDVLVGGAVGGTSVCVGRGAAVTDLSTASTTVSAADGAQDTNTKASTKPPCRNHIMLIERYSHPLRLLSTIHSSPASRQAWAVEKKDPLQFEAGQVSVGIAGHVAG